MIIFIRIFLVVILFSTISSFEFDYKPAGKALKVRQPNQKGPIFIKLKKPNDNCIFYFIVVILIFYDALIRFII